MKMSCALLVTTPHPRFARPLPERGEARVILPLPVGGRGEARVILPLPARGEGWGEGSLFSSL
jgi:hypothetical protein